MTGEDVAPGWRNAVAWERRLLYGIVLSLGTYAIPSLRFGGAGSGLSLGILIIPASCYLLALRVMKTRQLSVNKFLLYSVFLLCLGVSLSALFSVVFVGERIIRLAVFLSLPLLFSCTIRDRRALDLCLAGLVVIGVFLALYGFYGFFTGKIGDAAKSALWGTYYQYFGIHYLNSTRNGDIHYVAIPLFLVLAVGSSRERSGMVGFLLALVASLFLAGILLSFSRSAWVATLGAFLASHLLCHRPRGGSRRARSLFRPWMLLLLGVLPVIGSAVLTFNVTNYFIGKVASVASSKLARNYLQERVSNGERLEILGATVDIIVSNPLGVGPDNLRYVYPMHGIRVNHPENSYLHILAENGALAFVGFLILVFYPIRVFHRVARRNARSWRAVALYAVSVYLAISYLFNTEVFSLYCWVVHAVIWCGASILWATCDDPEVAPSGS